MKKSLLTSILACLIFATSSQAMPQERSIEENMIRGFVQVAAITAVQVTGWVYLAGRVLTHPETITKKELICANLPILTILAQDAASNLKGITSRMRERFKRERFKKR